MLSFYTSALHFLVGNLKGRGLQKCASGAVAIHAILTGDAV